VAPDVKFPSPLNDVINGYLGVISAFNPKIKRIIMMGDSAGGNLICSCVNYLILNGLRKPDKMLLLYPALVLNINFFCPSLLLAYNDEMINFFHLQYVLLLYLGKENMGQFYNMFISPLFTPHHILREYPEVSIICGDQDPIFDHSLYFTHLLGKEMVKVKLYIMKQFGHGFMSLYFRNNSWMEELKVVLKKIKSIISN
jgi:hormone-sensitive lipase